MKRIAGTVTVLAMLCLPATAAAAYGDGIGPDADDASCMALGSEFYADFAVTQRALVAHLVADANEVPGEWYRLFAAEKEGGDILFPCGTRME